MSGKRFSPAPWKRATNLSRNGSGKPRGLSFSRIVDANNQTVAYAYQRASRLEQVGNVNLIAAAPELFDFVSFFTTITGQTVLRCVPHNIAEQIYFKAKELTEKATGKSKEEK